MDLHNRGYRGYWTVSRCAILHSTTRLDVADLRHIHVGCRKRLMEDV